MPLPVLTADPLEVKLAFQTIACRTCHFFWPAAGGAQPYGPYSTFDFEENYPVQAQPAAGGQSFSWAAGLTAEPGFPQPEIMDGCRKAPIMTIGINPNLTSFFPGPTGASWCYPGFQSLGSSDPSVKYAYYYRYRSVYQEHFDNDPQFIAPYLQKTDAIVATADGKMGLIKVSGLEPPIEVTIDYTGQSAPVITKLNWAPGTPPYVILFSTGSDFEKGDILAAKLDVMAGVPVNVERQVVGYYEQFVPVLDYFNAFLQSKGINGAAARMGEDVCQLDMVACASPHWTPAFLGGTVAAENEVITNCVTDNAWVIKQLVQTKPAVLYIVGESSFDMFRDNLGNFIQGNQSLDTIPADGAFTLLRQTTDPANPVTLQYQYSAGGNTYSLSTRLVISPHFSFNYNFVPQFRFSPADLEKLEKSFAACYQYLTHTPGISQGQKQPGETYSAFLLSAPAVEHRAKRSLQQQPAGLGSGHRGKPGIPGPQRRLLQLLCQQPLELSEGLSLSKEHRACVTPRFPRIRSRGYGRKRETLGSAGHAFLC